MSDNRLFETVCSIVKQIPFNQQVGLKMVSISQEEAEMEFFMRDELVGNFMRKTLHGGVISSALDVVGGVVALVGIFENAGDIPWEEKEKRFAQLGTIDLRVDYLRPGAGEYFRAKGYILRSGNRVTVARMELHNNENKLIAVGTGTYIVA